MNLDYRVDRGLRTANDYGLSDVLKTVSLSVLDPYARSEDLALNAKLMINLQKKGINYDCLEQVISESHNVISDFESDCVKQISNGIKSYLGINRIEAGESEDFSHYSNDKIKFLKAILQPVIKHLRTDFNYSSKHVMNVLEDNFNVTFFYDTNEISEGKMYINPNTFSKVFNEVRTKHEGELSDYVMALLVGKAGIEDHEFTYENNNGILRAFYIDENNLFRGSGAKNENTRLITSNLTELLRNQEVLTDVMKQTLIYCPAINIYQFNELINTQLGACISKQEISKAYNNALIKPEQPINLELLNNLGKSLDIEELPFAEMMPLNTVLKYYSSIISGINGVHFEDISLGMIHAITSGKTAGLTMDGLNELINEVSNSSELTEKYTNLINSLM